MHQSVVDKFFKLKDTFRAKGDYYILVCSQYLDRGVLRFSGIGYDVATHNYVALQGNSATLDEYYDLVDKSEVLSEKREQLRLQQVFNSGLL